MSHPSRHDAHGFTLIEVLIAMLVVALGIGALLTTLSSSADIVGRLREKSFAQWIALNQIASLHLSGAQPGVGVTYGIEDYAGSRWRWQQEITDPGIAGIVRIEVRVALVVDGSTEESQTIGDAPMASVGSAFGFLSSSQQRPSGLSPDWSFSAAQSGTGGVPGGGGPPGVGGAPGAGAGVGGPGGGARGGGSPTGQQP